MVGRIRSYDEVMIAGYPVTAMSMTETAKLICKLGQRDRSTSEKPEIHTSINGQVVWLAERDQKLKEFLYSSDVVSCDSQPMVMFSRFACSRPLVERVAATDLIHVVAEYAQDVGASFFLLGGTEQENGKAAGALSSRYPRLKIAGRHHGYLDPSEELQVCRDIAERRPDILWVAMGTPREQQFVERWTTELKAVGVIKTCGGCFKILSGELARPWRIFQKTGFEWLGRMFLEPRHVVPRYITSTPMAIWLALTRINRK